MIIVDLPLHHIFLDVQTSGLPRCQVTAIATEIAMLLIANNRIFMTQLTIVSTEMTPIRGNLAIEMGVTAGDFIFIAAYAPTPGKRGDSRAYGQDSGEYSRSS
jgi:hypothetical protein